MNKDFLKRFIISTLGGSQLNVELTDEDLDFIIFHTINTYMRFSSEAFNEEWKVLRFVANNHLQEIPDDVDFVLDLNNVGGSINANIAPESYGTSYELTVLSMVLNDMKLGRANMMIPSKILYKDGKRYIQIDPAPTEDTNVAARVLTYKDTNMLYSDSWVMRYSVAFAKLVLGNIRNKYSGVASPNDMSMNGSDLVSQAQQEMPLLEQELFDTSVLFAGGIYVG